MTPSGTEVTGISPDVQTRTLEVVSEPWPHSEGLTPNRTFTGPVTSAGYWMTASEPIAPLEAGQSSTLQQGYPWVLNNPRKGVFILTCWGLWTG